MIVDIKKYPHSALAKQSKPIESIDKNTSSLIFDLFDTMYGNNGIGLAAPQIGVNKQVFVCHIPGEDQRYFINPVILEKDGQTISKEGCLSFPRNLILDVKRAEKIVVKYLDLDNNEKELEATGLLSACIQHEIDHLHGIVFTDKVSPFRRKLALRKLKRK